MIYDKPTRVLLEEWARDHLTSGQVFEKSLPISWFKSNYPKTKSNTVKAHVELMAVNNHRVRRNYPGRAMPGKGYDLFWKEEGSDRFRLWNSSIDPEPWYTGDIEPDADS